MTRDSIQATSPTCGPASTGCAIACSCWRSTSTNCPRSHARLKLFAHNRAALALATTIAIMAAAPARRFGRRSSQAARSRHRMGWRAHRAADDAAPAELRVQSAQRLFLLAPRRRASPRSCTKCRTRSASGTSTCCRQHADEAALTQSCDKEFFVSPFLEMDLRYEFSCHPPGEAVRVAMIVRREETLR